MNHIRILVSATQLSDDRCKSYQRKIWKEILIAINALLNSDGGKLTLRFDRSPPPSHVKNCQRKIEQKLIESIGVTTLVYNLEINEALDNDCSCIIIIVSPTTSELITLHHNLYLPSNQQVNEVSSKDSVEEVRKLCRREMPHVEAVEPGSHLREFIHGAPVLCGESQTVQFKLIVSTRTNNATLTQRLIRNNKLRENISAFANYAGGHIYVGVKDDGSVEGEKINSNDVTELRKDIAKAVEEMVWPEDSLSHGGEDKRWQIHFELVKNSSGEIVPETFVIVIYVAQCPGGVFTKEPEAYQVVEGEVKKIDFSAWKKMVLHGLVREKGEESNETIGDDALYVSVHEELAELLNDNCEWSDLKQATAKAEKTHKETEVRLICLAKLIKHCIRRCDHETADETLNKYSATLTECSTTELEVFEVIKQHLRILIERSKGNHDESYKIATSTLEKVEKIRPGIVSAEFYVVAATVVNIQLAMKTSSSSDEKLRLLTEANVLYKNARRHVKYVKSKSVKADIEQKIFTSLAMFHSGSSLAGCNLMNFYALNVDETKARNYLKEFNRIVNHGDAPSSDYREAQYQFAQADLFFLLANKSDETKKNQHLKNALILAERASRFANVFLEMKLYAQNRVAQIGQEMPTQS